VRARCVCVCVCVCVCRVCRACYIKLNADDFYLQIFKEIPLIKNDKTITIESADSRDPLDIEFIPIVDIFEIPKKLILVR